MASRTCKIGVWLLIVFAIGSCRSRSVESGAPGDTNEGIIQGEKPQPASIEEPAPGAKAQPTSISAPMKEVRTGADFDSLFANAEKWRYHDFYLEDGRTILTGRVVGPLGGDGVMGWFVPVHVVIDGKPDANRRAVLGLCLNDDLEGASCEAKGKSLTPGTPVRVAGTPSGKTSWLAKYGGEYQEDAALDLTVWTYP
jgi:hypothetical protein